MHPKLHFFTLMLLTVYETLEKCKISTRMFKCLGLNTTVLGQLDCSRKFLTN